MSVPPTSDANSAGDRFDDLTTPPPDGQSGSTEQRLRRALSQLTAELGFDEGFLVTGATVAGAGRPIIQVATGSTVDASIVEIVQWPWVLETMRRSGALTLVGAPASVPGISVQHQRRLWALGIRSLVCVPLRRTDIESGSVILCARQTRRPWHASALARLTGFAETASNMLLDTLAHDDDSTDQELLLGAHEPAPGDLRRTPEGNALREPRPRPDGDAEIVGESAAWRYVMFRVDQVAGTQATVLLLGETGTGKEVIARAIHQRSQRRNNRFVALNCSALPSTLIESELFGRERGAFTGAHANQAGRFEIAHRGTLFLDEVSDLQLELQPKLLRVLQEGQIDRLGSPRTVSVDVRVIAATNRDLAEDVRQNRFRCDLYYRLNVFPITLPSLRERREDIPLLVRHLTERFAGALRKPIKQISTQAMRTLQEYDWPGNVRELENVLQRAIIVSAGGVLSLDDICLPPPQHSPATPSGTTLTEVEREHILRVLAITSWRIEGGRGAAQMLGLKPSTLRSRLRKLGVRRQA
jgi:transcriptional regulator with GAF, ATPase, and Fis domain